MPAIDFVPLESDSMAGRPTTMKTSNAPRMLVVLGLIVLATVLLSTALSADGTPDSTARYSTGLGFDFNTGDYAVRTLGPGEVLFASDTPIDLDKDVPLDSQGVRQYVRDGEAFDHPVAQAQYGLELMNGWVVTEDERYLDRAIANAERLIDNAVDVDGSWFHPYRFDFPLHGVASDTMVAPWYSAMAQGEVLALFTRLYLATDEARWKSAAGHTFESLTTARDGTRRPWVVYVDGEGFLWFEEYASDRPDRTFNGHMFAILGLMEYLGISDDPRVPHLISGGLEMVKRYAPDIRVPGGVSRYCLAHEVHDEKYHMVHIDQFGLLFAYTGDPDFRRLATEFRSDYSGE